MASRSTPANTATGVTGYTGWFKNDADTTSDTTMKTAAYHRGTKILEIDDVSAAITGTLTSSGALVVTAGGLTVTAGGLTVTAGGITLTAGVLSVDDTTDTSSAVTGSIHTDGGLGVAKKMYLGLDLLNSDGAGADGEQLTSGGAGATTDWAAAACLKKFKNIGDERTDDDDALASIVDTPVYDFKYKTKEESEEHIMSTGDMETTYTGIMADDAPWATHHHGRILNPISTFGYTVMGMKALDSRLKALEAAV